MDWEKIYENTLKLYEANPIGKDSMGNSIFEFNSINDLPNELFITPSFSVLLPPPNNILLKSVCKQEKKVLLKKHAIERMLKEHKELYNNVKENKTILQNAIYEATNVMICQKIKKPDYISFIKISDYYYVSVLDFNSNHKYIEVVDWRKIGDDGFLRMINQASVGASNSP